MIPENGAIREAAWKFFENSFKARITDLGKGNWDLIPRSIAQVENF